jgi:hypothetical protein
VQIAYSLAGEWSQPDKEEWLVADADAALRRAQRPDDPRKLDLLIARATLACQRGDHAGALDVYHRIRSQLDSESPELGKEIARDFS